LVHALSTSLQDLPPQSSSCVLVLHGTHWPKVGVPGRRPQRSLPARPVHDSSDVHGPHVPSDLHEGASTVEQSLSSAQLTQWPTFEVPDI
jgi:hypothetical protein